ncbi:MAG: hypothetical protein LBV12_04140 [Puniceicoccales bacterium]|jgi:WD40 repeat protein|nr:hypothetical protein [Puniceicoccales bacterium]
MNQLRRPPFSVHIIILILATVFAVFLLPGCSKTPEDHARIAKTSTDLEKAMASVLALNDQTLLADVAANAAEANTQSAALDKLTDERLLADVIKGIEPQKDQLVTATRLEKVTDPQLLASLAREALSVNVRVDAAVRLGDQALLEDIARSNAGGNIRQKAIAKLDNQTVLADVAQNDRDEDVRLEATRRVTDQTLLAGIAQNEKTARPVRVEAIARLDDQRILATIAGTAGKDLAERRSLESLRLKALTRLTDPQALIAVAKGVAGDMPFESQYEDGLILRAVLEQISDQTALADIATSADLLAYAIVLEKITDQAVLARLYENKNVSHMRDAIVQQLTDQKLLAAIAGGEDYEHIRMEAVNRLTDTQALLDLARRSKDEGIAFASAKKIDAPQTLAALAADEGINIAPRLWAVWHMDDRALLARIAENATDARVREAASEKLSGITPGTTQQPMVDLMKTGKILAEIHGGGIQHVFVRLRKTVPYPLEVLIPAGTYFVCDNPKAQNMVSTEDVRIALAKTESETDSQPVSVACANRPKDVPSGGDRFTIGSLPDGDALSKLMAAMKGRNIVFATKQAAVWILTDDADFNDLGKLVTTTSSASGGVLRQTGSSRTIQPPVAVAAMRLCADSGVDIKKKTIWRDASQLHADLPPGELREWLRTLGSFTQPTHARGIANLLVSPDGKLLLTADDAGDAKLWSLPDGKLLKTLDRGLGYRSAVISPDGKQLVTEKGAVFSLPDGNLVQKRRDETWGDWRSLCGRMVLSPDGSLLAGVTSDYQTGLESIKVFRLSDGVCLTTLETGVHNAHPIVISPDTKQLAAPGVGGSLRFWSLPDGKLVRTLEKESNSHISRDWKWRIFFRYEQKELVRGKAMVSTHCALDLHSPTNGALVGTLGIYPGIVDTRFTTISPDGSHLLLVINDTMRILSIPDGAVLLTVEKAEFLAISPDGKLLITRENGLLHARRLPDGEILGSFKLPGDANTSRRNAIVSADNTLLIVDDSGINEPATVKLWSLPDGKLIKSLEGE